MKKKSNMVMFACNQGGHFSQMMALNELFGKYDSVLVTDNVRATKEMPALKDIGNIEYAMAMADMRKKKAASGKNGDNRFGFLLGYLKQLKECRIIIKKYSPAVIISTGSNIAVPLFFWGKIYGSKLIFIETRAKVYSKSLTGKIVSKFSDQIFVQWPEMLQLYPEARYCGTLV